MKLQDEQERLVSVSSPTSDVTRIEEALREAEAKYRDIFENAVNGIFRTTPHGGYLDVNPAFAQMCGFESPEQMLRAVADVEEQYVNAGDRAILKGLLEQNDSVSRFETEIYRKDRSKVWVSINARTVRDANGVTLSYEGFVEDITQRKIAENELLKEKETFFTILDNDPVGVILSDRIGQYVFVNREFTNITGYTLKDVPTGKDWYEKAYPDPSYRAIVRNAWKENASQTGGEWMDVEFIITCHDGQTKDIEFRSTFLTDYSITVL